MRKRDLETLHEIVERAGGFGHREHLELAWTYLHCYSVDEATMAISAAIRRVARQHGAEDKYHETLTRTWLHFVAVHVQRWDGASFEEFLEGNPALLEPTLIHHFYSPAVLRSEPARASWRPPDLRRLPALV
jgi:hypothetical protein